MIFYNPASSIHTSLARPHVISLLQVHSCSEQGEHLAESYGVPFFEVSAKNGAGVHEAFLHLGKTILEAR